MTKARKFQFKEDIKTEIIRVHDHFWQALGDRDIEARFSFCDDHVTFIGTGLNEKAANKEEYIAINEKGIEQYPKKFKIHFLWKQVSFIDDLAWVESEVEWEINLDEMVDKETIRSTVVLKKRGGIWKIVHVHGSVPDYRYTGQNYMSTNETQRKNRELEMEVYKRTIELENKSRELEIEGSLERVRAVAMGMKEPGDMPGVCKAISSQLQSLGVKEIRNVQTAIFYEQRGTYMNYEFYAKHDKTFITETTYTNNEIHNEFAIKMLRGKGENYITHIRGDEVKDWIAYQKTTNVFIDKYLETASSLSYHWFSLGPVALGISTYIPLADDEINLFKRFLKVFELAYQRYLDIEKAEAHAEQAALDLIKLKEEKRRTEEALAELKATQAQLIHAEKMASLGELTAGIAHEIQNPLNFVNNFSEVSAELVDEMKQELAVGSWQSVGQLADDIKQNLKKINHHGKRADAIVKGMLQHSRSSNGLKELTDINALADEYLRLAFHGLRAKDKSFNADFKTDFDENLPKINVIPQDIGRVLLNLVNNAFYAVSQKDLLGSLNLTGHHGPDYKPQVIVSTKKLDRAVEIRVKDNGNGIPATALDKIFQPFFTTKPTGQGTGLGLSLSYDIIKAHGGELKVETKAGEGTEFIIHIPE